MKRYSGAGSTKMVVVDKEEVDREEVERVEPPIVINSFRFFFFSQLMQNHLLFSPGDVRLQCETSPLQFQTRDQSLKWGRAREKRASGHRCERGDFLISLSLSRQAAAGNGNEFFSSFARHLCFHFYLFTVHPV